MAPTQSEPRFAVALLLVLLVFIGIGFASLRALPSLPRGLPA